MKIRKEKEENISDIMHRINESYLSAELDKFPVETLVLLHLLTLLPSDPLSERIKAWLVEAMRVEPNIKSRRRHTYSSRRATPSPARGPRRTTR